MDKNPATATTSESGWWETNTVADLLRSLPPREIWTAALDETVSVACGRMKEHGVSQLPVVDDGRLVGIIAESDVLARIVSGRTSLGDVVAEAMLRDVRTVSVDDDASTLTSLFADGFLGVVVDDESQLHGVISKMDLVDFLTRHVEVPH